MHSDELIKSLSDNGNKDLESSLQWINPIPEDASALIEKIDMALNIVKFSKSRRTEEGEETSNNHLDSLIRLKAEISSILNEKLK
ncbi:hypothetical protein [Colwellia sp. Arc7-D]|jgi:hypothetical protein|uniref:hypothetical protein n=1 Tax=Colwellia sp. Arc7-D TaxID=2161872 RepID=UPI000D3DC665|nr:hypothetical protein [Colwellia sp. Arc7-D]AWB57741.1 hypothetical protein DBO93_09260 [Colwellia sp. Arc7-D]|tara:strand:- start:161 stop:415 length:255 start_codon:yes stop_codon:yes gene_type:complete